MMMPQVFSKLYLKQYRPLLAEPGSPWLFPGRKGTHKCAAVLARQMKAYIWEGAGIPFHPHLIRKIATKIILDDNPAAIEIARITLGHEDLRTTRGAYVQAQVRSAQTLYLEAMEERRAGRHPFIAAPGSQAIGATGASGRQGSARPERRPRMSSSANTPAHRGVAARRPGLWRRATRKAKLFDDDGRAGHWSATSKINAEKAYGLWLAFLASAGQLDPFEPPVARVTEDRLQAYLQTLQGRKSHVDRQPVSGSA